MKPTMMLILLSAAMMMMMTTTGVSARGSMTWNSTLEDWYFDDAFTTSYFPGSYLPFTAMREAMVVVPHIPGEHSWLEYAQQLPDSPMINQGALYKAVAKPLAMAAGPGLFFAAITLLLVLVYPCFAVCSCACCFKSKPRGGQKPSCEARFGLFCTSTILFLLVAPVVVFSIVVGISAAFSINNTVRSVLATTGDSISHVNRLSRHLVRDASQATIEDDFTEVRSKMSREMANIMAQSDTFTAKMTTLASDIIALDAKYQALPKASRPEPAATLTHDKLLPGATAIKQQAAALTDAVKSTSSKVAGSSAASALPFSLAGVADIADSINDKVSSISNKWDDARQWTPFQRIKSNTVASVCCLLIFPVLGVVLSVVSGCLHKQWPFHCVMFLTLVGSFLLFVLSAQSMLSVVAVDKVCDVVFTTELPFDIVNGFETCSFDSSRDDDLIKVVGFDLKALAADAWATSKARQWVVDPAQGLNGHSVVEYASLVQFVAANDTTGRAAAMGRSGRLAAAASHSFDSFVASESQQKEWIIGSFVNETAADIVDTYRCSWAGDAAHSVVNHVCVGLVSALDCVWFVCFCIALLTPFVYLFVFLQAWAIRAPSDDGDDKLGSYTPLMSVNQSRNTPYVPRN